MADAQHELEIGSKHSIFDWNQYCRDIAVSHFINNPVQIGGPGHIVQIDESLFSIKKIQPRENSTGTVDFWRL